MTAAAGDRLADRFDLEGPLGEGLSGVVWAARDVATEEAVAVKLLHEHLVADPAALERLRAEAGVAARLRHPGVVAARGLWRDGARWLLVSERFDGRPLGEDPVAMAPEAVIALGIELAGALEAAHRAGIVHGDVRPGNVLVGAAGARLFDFGTATLPGAGSRTRPGQTPPEVLDGAPGGVRGDLYGLGVVLARALAGRDPFPGATPWARIAAQRAGAPPLAGPRGLVALIHLLVAPDPAHRPPAASGVRTALERLATAPLARVRVGPATPHWARGGWVVHGRDPATGLPGVIAQGLGRRAARGLARRLGEAGWSVEATREALDGRDGLDVLGAAALGTVLLPGVGGPLAAWWTYRHLAQQVRPGLSTSLPRIVTPAPPREAPPHVEYAVTAALLSFATAGTMLFSSLLAAFPGLLLVVVLLAWSRATPRSPERAAAEARLEAALADAERRLSGATSDAALVVLGELATIRRDRAAGRVSLDAAVLRAESAAARAVGIAPVLPVTPAIAALRHGGAAAPVP